jgi:TetR/AcrR family transcriptional regulator
MKTYEGCDGASRVLQAAEKLFAEHGYDGVSASMIAEAASVSKANIFHHFHSKEQLYVEVMKHISGTLMTELEKQDNADLATCARIVAFVKAHLCFFSANKSLARLILREMGDAFCHVGGEYPQQEFESVLRLLIGIIEDGQRRHEIQPETEPFLLAFFLLGANILLAAGDDIIPDITQQGYVKDPEKLAQIVYHFFHHVLCLKAEHNQGM